MNVHHLNCGTMRMPTVPTLVSHPARRKARQPAGHQPVLTLETNAVQDPRGPAPHPPATRRRSKASGQAAGSARSRPADSDPIVVRLAQAEGQELELVRRRTRHLIT